MMLRLGLRCATFLIAPAILVSSPQALRESAHSAGVLVGTAVRPSLFSEAAYSATLAREFNMVEPEDAMKWWTVRRNADTFDFREGDEVARFAQAHDMKVRGHCLVWDHDNPEWLAQGHFTPAHLSHLLQEHIATVMKHYAGQVFAWDVVNEALDENGRVKDSPGTTNPASDCLTRARPTSSRPFAGRMTPTHRRCSSITKTVAKASIANPMPSTPW